MQLRDGVLHCFLGVQAQACTQSCNTIATVMVLVKPGLLLRPCAQEWHHICMHVSLHKASKLCAIGLQDPVSSALWLTAMLQLSNIPIKIVQEVWFFCDAPMRSKPFILLVAVYTVVVLTLTLAGPVDKANLFQLYTFPVLFRVQQVAIVAVATVCFAIVRHFVEDCPHDRVAPA